MHFSKPRIIIAPIHTHRLSHVAVIILLSFVCLRSGGHLAVSHSWEGVTDSRSF